MEENQGSITVPPIVLPLGTITLPPIVLPLMDEKADLEGNEPTSTTTAALITGQPMPWFISESDLRDRYNGDNRLRPTVAEILDNLSDVFPSLLFRQ